MISLDFVSLLMVTILIIFLWSVVMIFREVVISFGGYNADETGDCYRAQTLASATKRFPYVRKDYLFSPGEKRFYEFITRLLGDEYLLLSKVRLTDLFVLPGMPTRRYNRSLRKVESGYIDFVVCDKRDFSPVLAIELEDVFRGEPEHIKRERFVDELFRHARLPIVHVDESASYDRADFLKRVQTVMVSEMPLRIHA